MKRILEEEQPIGAGLRDSLGMTWLIYGIMFFADSVMRDSEVKACLNHCKTAVVRSLHSSSSTVSFELRQALSWLLLAIDIHDQVDRLRTTGQYVPSRTVYPHTTGQHVPPRNVYPNTSTPYVASQTSVSAAAVTTVPQTQLSGAQSAGA